MAQDQAVPFAISDRFRIERKLGAGGMGVVYAAFDRERQVHVAIKTLRSLDAVGLYRFKQEFRSLADIYHAHLVPLYELIGEGQQWFITMELVDGVDLIRFLRPDESDDAAETPTVLHADTKDNAFPAAPMPGAVAPAAAEAGVDFQRLRQTFAQLASGVAALHAHGKLHRDIKPSNTIVRPDGTVLLMDFGLVTDSAVIVPAEPSTEPRSALSHSGGSSGSDTTGHLLVGTVKYMSPEQAAAQRATEASDWYSFGVMLFESLTGTLPFGGSASNILSGKKSHDAPPPSAIVAGIPPDLERLCIGLLQRDPEARPKLAEIFQVLGSDDTGVSGAESLPATLPFIGRGEQLAAIERAYAHMRDGATVVVHVRGPSGVGKSTLVRRYLGIHESRADAVLLSARCYEQESVPYKAVDSLMDSLSRHLHSLPEADCAALLPRHISALSRIFPVLQRVAAVGHAPETTSGRDDPVEVRRRAFGALRELLARIGDRRPLVLFIDDLQWGDLDSAKLLNDLLQPPDPPRLLLLLSYRSEYVGTSACLQALTELRSHDEAAVEQVSLDVGALTPEESRQMLCELMGETHTSDEETISAIVEQSQGRPFFVLELAQHVKSGRRLQHHAHGESGVMLDEIVWDRVARLPAPTRRLLEVIAVAGQPVPLGAAYQATGCTAMDPHLAAPLRSGHLIRTLGGGVQAEVETFHDRIRESVVAHLAQDVLVQHHAGLARALERAEAIDPETIAVHWDAAGDPVAARRHYELAAVQASQALAFERAAGLFRRAVELHADDREAARALETRLAEALVNAGRSADAARVFLDVAAETEDAQLASELEQQAAQHFCAGGHLDEGRAVLGRVLRRFGLKLPETQNQALILLLLHRAKLRLRGLRFKDRTATDVPVVDRQRVDLAWAVASGMAAKNNIIAPAFSSLGLWLALKAGDPRRVVRALCWEAAQVSIDGISASARAQYLLGRAEEIISRLDDPYLDGMAAFAHGQLKFCLGEWVAGQENMDEAAETFRSRCPGTYLEVGQAHTFSLWCIAYQGNWLEMRRRADELNRIAVEKGDLFTVANLGTFMLPLCRLADDDVAAAQTTIDAAMRQWTQMDTNLQHFTAVLGGTYIDLYRADPQATYDRHAREWGRFKKAMLTRAQICHIVLQEAFARSAIALAGRGGGSSRLLAEAESRANKVLNEKMPYGTAWGTLLLAGIAFGRGDRSGCERQLRAAIDRLEGAHMRLFATVARRRLGELLGGADGRRMVDEANAWMKEQTIRNPDRMAYALAPWGP